MRLLVTRPEPDAQRTAAALRARSHEVVVAPLLRIEPMSDARIDNSAWEAILLTSGNAARAIAVHQRRKALAGVPVFTVGERSGESMREAGFATVVSASGGVNELVRLVIERVKKGGLLLYLAGEQRSGDLAGELQRNGFMVHTVVVYRAVAVDKLPQAAVDALADGVDAVLHFSRRSAEAYVKAAGSSDMLAGALKPVHFCLSAEVAQPLACAGIAVLRIAPRPTEAALIELIAEASG